MKSDIILLQSMELYSLYMQNHLYWENEFAVKGESLILKPQHWLFSSRKFERPSSIWQETASVSDCNGLLQHTDAKPHTSGRLHCWQSYPSEGPSAA